MQETELLTVITEDGCCGQALSKALTSKNPPGETWTHRKCGCEWRSAVKPGGVLLWYPVTVIEVF